MVDTTAPLSMGAALSAFYAEAPQLRHPALRARALRVVDHLAVYLDTEAEAALLPDELVLVEAERQLDPAGAVARVTGPAALVAALPGFLEEAWLLPRTADALVQLDLVDALADWLVCTGVVDARQMEVSFVELAAMHAQARAVLAAREG